MKLLYITSKDEKEAKQIAKVLVKEKLVACVNIHSIDSVYEWKGKIEDGNEVVMIAKTTDDLVYEAMEKVKELHSYDCPCILVIPVETANKEFVEWMNKVTKK